jgi:hypothetical protein
MKRKRLENPGYNRTIVKSGLFAIDLKGKISEK